MNYKESKEISEEIKKARSILLNCHIRPDSDSIGSALAMYQLLNSMNKKVRIICPDAIPHNMHFLPFVDQIEKVDFNKFDFSGYDLFIIQDTSVWKRVSGDNNIPIPKMKIVIIDNHDTGEEYGDLRLIDKTTSSVSEMLFLIFKDWEVGLNKDISDCLLAGVLGETGVFEYINTSSRTLKVASELLERGADKDRAILHIFQSQDPRVLKFWSIVLSKIQVDKEHRFVWAAIQYKDYREFSDIIGLRSDTADMFFRIVDSTDFGLLMVEEMNGALRISLRSRKNDCDVSAIALKIGGGGHKAASSAEVIGMTFEKAVEKVLETARKFAK